MFSIKLVNAAWQLGHDKALIRNASDDVDMLAVVEARDFENDPVDIQSILGSKWQTAQDTTTGMTSGSAFATRIDSECKMLRWRLNTLSLAVRRKVQKRLILNVTEKIRNRKVRIAVVHFPIKSTGQQDEAKKVVRRWVRNQRACKRLGLIKGFILLGDFNSDVKVLARELNLHHVKSDVMGILWSGGWPELHLSVSHSPYSDHGILRLSTEKDN